MPGAILPVKRPETDPGLIPRGQRDLVSLRLHENKRQESAAGFKMEKKHDRDPDAEANFLQSANPRSDH
jgi:hypothetical protein